MSYLENNIACLVKFIESQLAHRNKILEEKLPTHIYDRKETSIIVAAGTRGFGTSSAVASIFNQNNDVYIALNTASIREFKIKLQNIQNTCSHNCFMACTVEDFISRKIDFLRGRQINRIYVDGILYSDFNKIIDAYNKLPFNVPLIMV